MLADCLQQLSGACCEGMVWRYEAELGQHADREGMEATEWIWDCKQGMFPACLIPEELH